MRKSVGVLALVAVLAGGAYAQNAPATPKLQFEVATVKPAAPLNPQAIAAGKLHVGMQIDQARVDIGFLSLADLIQAAYKIKTHQLIAPDWLKSERFDIMAKMPEGSNKDQVPEMLQSLLADRFKLQFHKEPREQPVMGLVVGKGGPKLKESAKEDPAAAPKAEAKGEQTIQFGGGQMRQSGNSMVMTTKDQPGQLKMTMVDGKMKMEGTHLKMEAVAEMVARFVGKPVVDMTELKGEYDVSLEISMQEIMAMAQKMGVAVPGMMPGAGSGGGAEGRPADAASDPTASGSIFTSIQAMGLKLENRKAPVDTIIVDRIEKTPTEN